jgi:hypothetical protein
VLACIATPERPNHHAWTALAHKWQMLREPAIARAGLLPQLMHASELVGVALDPEVRSVLRAARTHEELRIQAWTPACREALSESGRQWLVLRGMALSHTVYDHPALRHCHDLDLLVPGAARSDTHDSGLPIRRHSTLFGPFERAVTWADVQSGAVTAQVAGVQSRVLAPADGLVHICVHAGTNGCPHSPLWCVDAALLIRNNSPLDWDHVVARTRQWKVALHAYRSLNWLRKSLGVAVPPNTLTALRLQAMSEAGRRLKRLLARSIRARGE